MKVLILAYTFETYATERLALRLRERGHDVCLASPLELSLRLGTSGASVLRRDELLAQPDLVLLRGITYLENGVVVPRSLELSIAGALAHAGATCINSCDSKRVVTDKLIALQKLVQMGLAIPETFLSWSSQSIDEIVDQLGLPIVIKTTDGTWGIGVARCDSIQSARSTFQLLRGLGLSFVVQKYVAESGGDSIRALIVGDRVLGALRAKPREGDFRSNISQGGAAEPFSLPAAYARLALDAARATGLEIAGVDLVESVEGPLVLEVNSVPGFEAIDRVCKIDSSLSVIEYMEAKDASASARRQSPPAAPGS